jgi:hypothetical protein
MGVMNEIPEQLGLKGIHSSKMGVKMMLKNSSRAQSCGMFESQIVPKMIMSRY